VCLQNHQHSRGERDAGSEVELLQTLRLVCHGFDCVACVRVLCQNEQCLPGEFSLGDRGRRRAGIKFRGKSQAKVRSPIDLPGNHRCAGAGDHAKNALSHNVVKLLDYVWHSSPSKTALCSLRRKLAQARFPPHRFELALLGRWDIVADDGEILGDRVGQMTVIHTKKCPNTLNHPATTFKEVSLFRSQFSQLAVADGGSVLVALLLFNRQGLAIPLFGGCEVASLLRDRSKLVVSVGGAVLVSVFLLYGEGFEIPSLGSG